MPVKRSLAHHIKETEKEEERAHVRERKMG
jgi:hypothetical protein